MKYALIATCAASLLSAAAHAQTETLDYVGSAFTSVTITGNMSSGSANSVPENTGEIVFSSPLADNLNNVSVNPLSYTFDSTTEFGLYLSSNNPYAGFPGNSASFLVSTNANGVLVGWNIAVTGGVFAGTNTTSYADLTITDTGDTYSSGLSSPECAQPTSTECYQVTESNTSKGSWSPTANAPEIDPASAASAVTLLFFSIALMGGKRPKDWRAPG